MRPRARQPVERIALLEPHRRARLPRQIDHLLHPRAAQTFSYKNALQRALRPQSFDNGMDT